MSVIAINEYLRELEKLKHLSGKANEGAISIAFHKLLSTYAKAKDLELVAQQSFRNTKDKTIRPDGTLKDNLRLDWGYWESKDEYDDLDKEIAAKLAKGYPSDNIIFEDGKTVVLYRNGYEKSRVNVSDTAALDKTLKDFVSYERPEVSEFRKAIELFKADIPNATQALRETITLHAENNKDYIYARDFFLELCREVINPKISNDDVREMVVQHILTADIFNTIFDEPHFHQENNIARELEKLTNTFFTKEIRRNTLARIKHYYDAINAQAARIDDHHEKQKFLKVVYENFYKSYSPKKADRLGVVYTPNEIVRFMIESTDYLLQKHFGKQLEDKGVDILDPATGTGTFVCDLIDHFGKANLEYKYRHELHANEVEILPYYIANLNIEFTYKQKTGKYMEFENLCFVDTLDNYVNLNKDAEMDIFSLTDENAERIKRQNEKKISVIIGNPPYNANQMNENENNKNREYPKIDKRIKETYIKNSTAQKTKLYDMYSRFYRWAMDRLDCKGIIAFITNRSFIDSRTFDGFRKTIRDEFDYAYIVDTKSDVRQNPKIAGTSHNVFGIQAGVAVMFLVKINPRSNTQCRIHYTAMDDYWLKEDKLAWLMENKIQDIPFKNITPDIDHNWINLVENDWDDMIAVADKVVKTGTSSNAIFKLFSLGLVTNRDEWVYDLERSHLENKVSYLISNYEADKDRLKGNVSKSNIKDLTDKSIKWTRLLYNEMLRGTCLTFSDSNILESLYRPFTKQFVYFSKELNEMQYQLPNMLMQQNNFIVFSGTSSSKPFSCLVTNVIPNLDMIEKTQCVSIYYIAKDGSQIDNITDWAMEQFRNQYQDDKIAKEDIFHYVYGVLHDPAYRSKYEINLKRSLPRVPFKQDFWLWTAWGKELMDMHIGFESVQPYPLEIVESPIDDDAVPKAKLKADKAAGIIVLDDKTTLTGIPETAWEYKLGNRCALEWILDQYKEKKPKDPTIARLFNTYRFADYKDKVIDLLNRVCTVSVKTVEIVKQMKQIAKDI